MKIKILAMFLVLGPCVAFAAARDDGSRVGVRGASMATLHGANMTIGMTKTSGATNTATTTTSGGTSTGGGTNTGGGNTSGTSTGGGTNTGGNTTTGSSDCRAAYRACMDDFCLLDESEGNRCACSSNINKSKSLIKEIQAIQDEAEKLYTEGVEREQLGARAKLVFGESAAAQKSSQKSGISFSEWLNADTGDTSLASDTEIGDELYSMAASYCAEQLSACGSRSEMEEALYTRMVVADCKTYESYLAEQKRNANANKRTAEAAVRKARLEMIGTTNKYNSGECLLAYRSCIADKGGCGANFENCLDESLLMRRANACENILDQCTASRTKVLADWEDEMVYILAEAKKYSEKNMRLTCLAKIQACLEDGCSTSTNSMCLTDVNVAAGVCPIITECQTMIPGIQTLVNNKLKYLQFRFCENDVDKCLQDKCGPDYTGPECLGKSPRDIADTLCPQSLFPSCSGKTETDFNIIVSSALLKMDYRALVGCVNYFGEKLGQVCGTDMSCLPNNDRVEALTTLPTDLDALNTELTNLRSQVRGDAKSAVDAFFVQFEKDKTIDACKSGASDANGVQGAQLGDNVFNTAKIIAEINAENRYLRALEAKVTEISKKQDVEAARQNCLATYPKEDPKEGKDNYSYIRSVSFEPSLRNCHVCRMQQVCEVGGESKGTSALKAAAGGLSGGAATGTMVSAGWGTAIGGAVGAIGGAILGGMSGGKQKFCQEIESCEDINM